MLIRFTPPIKGTVTMLLSVGKLQLSAGFNDVDDDFWAKAKDTPEVQAKIKEGVIVPMGDTSTEDKASGQPMPIQDTNVDQPIVQGEKKEPEAKSSILVPGPVNTGVTNVNDASEASLINLPGVGKVTAERIIEGRPYESLEDVKEASKLTDADWEKVEPLIEV